MPTSHSGLILLAKNGLGTPYWTSCFHMTSVSNLFLHQISKAGLIMIGWIWLCSIFCEIGFTLVIMNIDFFREGRPCALSLFCKTHRFIFSLVKNASYWISRFSKSFQLGALKMPFSVNFACRRWWQITKNKRWSFFTVSAWFLLITEVPSTPLISKEEMTMD